MHDAHNFISTSLNQHIMHYFSYANVRGMINTPKRFVARCRHVQGLPFQPLTFPSINWFSNLCPRKLVVDTQFSLVIYGVLKFHKGHFGERSLKLHQHLSLQTHDCKYSECTTHFLCCGIAHRCSSK